MSTTLILGATGATGQPSLRSLLSSAQVTSIHSLGRRHLPLPSPAPTKLTNTVIDFDALLSASKVEEDKLASVHADHVVITLGTTKKDAGGLENFYRIDREYVLAAAKSARVEGKGQTLVYCSSGSASSGSYFPYLKSKGLTEEGLASLGYKEVIIFRPGMLVVPGGRDSHRLAESVAARVTGVLAHFSSSIQIQVPTLGQAIVNASLLGVEGLKAKGLGKEESLPNGKQVWGIGNADAEKLGKLTL